MSSDLIINERIKLFANALDRASTASLTVGVIAPLAATLYGLQSAGPSTALLVLGTGVWLFAAVALHLGARVILGGLKS